MGTLPRPIPLRYRSLWDWCVLLLPSFTSLAEEVSTLTILLLRLGDSPFGNQSLSGLRASTCTLGGTELNVYHVSLRLKVNFTYKYVWGGFTMTATIIPSPVIRRINKLKQNFNRFIHSITVPAFYSQAIPGSGLYWLQCKKLNLPMG